MKRYKGSEIIKKVEDKEIKHGAKIKSDDGDTFTYDADDSTFYWEKNVGGDRVPIYTFLNHTFELIEDNTIDDIEELKEFELDEFINMGNSERFDRTMIEYSKINSILKWAKQADKEIKELKEK